MKHFLIRYKNINDESWNQLYVSCRLICGFQSVNYTTTEEQALKRAVAYVLGTSVLNIEDVEFDEKQIAVDILGQPIIDTFVINEHMSGFSLTHVSSGKNHWLSDGVDVMSIELFEDEDEDEVTLHPGTLGFVEAWTDTFNQSVGETLEAYFPDLKDE